MFPRFFPPSPNLQLPPLRRLFPDLDSPEEVGLCDGRPLPTGWIDGPELGARSAGRRATALFLWSPMTMANVTLARHFRTSVGGQLLFSAEVLREVRLPKRGQDRGLVHLVSWIFRCS